MRYRIRAIALFTVVMVFSTFIVGCGKSSDKVDASSLSQASQSEDTGYSNLLEDNSSVDAESSTVSANSFDNVAGKTSTPDKKPASSTGTDGKQDVVGAESEQITEKPTPNNFYSKIKGTTVKVYNAADPSKENLKLADAFYKKYGCKVQWEVMAWNEFKTKLLQSVAAKNTVDYFQYFDNQFAGFAANNVLQPVDNYIYIADKTWDKQVMSLFKWSGKRYGMYSSLLPNSDFGMIYYNKTMFENAGQKEPIEYYNEGKWNFETFKQVALDMTTDENGDGTTDVYGFATWWWDWAVSANGNRQVEIKDNKTVEITLNQASAYKGMQLLADLTKRKAYLYSDQWGEFFKQSRSAMIFERPWNAIGYYDLYNTGNFEIGVCPPPQGPDTKTVYAPSIIAAGGIPSGAKNPLGAAAYYFFKSNYDYEHRNDAETMKNTRKYISEEHQKIIDAYRNKSVRINTQVDGFGNWVSVRNNMWQDIFVKQIPPSTAVSAHLNELKYEINSTLRGTK
ncbi:MAG: extracellular solute-binding protein [Clostridiales bacterium]|nr:extracellular solute-binding protein [Clostridiales bacterium]